MHGLPLRVRRSWVKIQSQNGPRLYSTFLNNYTIFEEINYIATLSTKVQSLSEIDFLRFAAIFRICLINADIRS